MSRGSRRRAPAEAQTGSTLAGALVRAQAAELRGVDLDERRANELAAEVARMNAAANAAREALDFNDEPARYARALCAAGAPTA